MITMDNFRGFCNEICQMHPTTRQGPPNLSALSNTYG
jgi:hypothetical protein